MRLFRNRDSLSLADLPSRTDDGTLCRDIAGSSGPAASSLVFSCGIDMQWETYRSLKLRDRDRLERGNYRILRRYIRVEDLFGVLKYQRNDPSEFSLTVYPAGREDVRSSPGDPLFDSADFSRPMILKDQAFFESRPYYPGDDPRRINWNLLARYGDFFIKEGFRMKPDDQSLLILLNGAGNPSEVDSLMRECRVWMEHALGNGMGVSVLSPGEVSPVNFTPGTEAVRVQDFLASVPPEPLRGARLSFKNSTRSILFFSVLSELPERVPGPFQPGSSPLLLTSMDPDRNYREKMDAYRKGGWRVLQIP